MGALTGWVSEIPEWAQSRKILLTCLTFAVLLILAVAGTIVVAIFDGNASLFETAMNYVFGGGALGTGAQGVVDTLQARNNAYQPPVQRPSTSVAPFNQPITTSHTTQSNDRPPSSGLLGG